MFRFRSVVLALAALLVLPFSFAAPAHAQIYVDADATGNDDGTSWTDAYTDLQTALGTATGSDEIWIAEGTYTPGSNRGDSFTITGAKDGLKIYGGFESGDSFSDRNPADHPVVLSGDVGTTGDDSDNSYHVLFFDGTSGGNVTGATVLDGVTVTGGNADGSGFEPQRGGGLYCAGNGSGNACSPTITGVIFSGNNSANRGGAIYNIGVTGGESSPTITNAAFSGNTADAGGGAIYNNGLGGESSPTIRNAVFTDNTASNGGALYNHGVNGGTSSPQITNVTFTGNAANTQDGGAIYNYGSGGTSAPTITNAIFWNDSAAGSGDEIFNSSAAPTLSHTLIEGGCPSGSTCSDLLTADPLFVDIGDPDGPDDTFATDDGLRLFPGSPAVDAGDNSAISLTEDFTSAPRTQNGTVDLGPYERSPTDPALTIYVDADATGGNTGSSWTDAFTTLQAAIAQATSNDEIWVAEGTYHPDEGDGIVAGTRDTSFAVTGLRNGLEIYGGFESGDSFSDRNPADHPVVLSGDIGTTGDDSDNSYHVLFFDGTTGGTVTSATVLDGVTVTGGNANDSIFPDNVGGGLYCKGINSGNECSPTITGVTFSNNNSTNHGGAIYNFGATGGASSPQITNTAFSGNTADVRGGAIYNNGIGGESSPTITNTLFADNSTGNGGALYNMGTSGGTSSPQITNVTFTGNTASIPSNNGDGGAIYNNEGSPTITNAIFWDDSADGSGDEIYNNSASPTLSHTLIQGGCPSGGTCSDLLTADPLFIDAGDPDGPDGAFATDDDGLRLQAGSPAVDAGDNSAISLTDDLTGAPRTQNGTVDLGPYERPAATIYVDKDASGAGDGTSWADAYTDLQTALSNAAFTSELWVAEGVYTPDPDGTDETVSFTITGAKDGLEIYGGFEGNESNRDEREPKQHVTVLSGDIGGDDTTNDDGVTEEASDISGANSDHVLFLDGTSGGTITNSTVIDGVTVTAGEASEGFPDGYGGGLFCDGTDPGNECSPVLENVVFAGNSADSDGGAIYNTGIGGTSIPSIKNTLFSDNTADNGGAIYNDGLSGGSESSPQITNAAFTGNIASTGGGAIYNAGSFGGTASPQVTNATFWGNSAVDGGAIFNNGEDQGTASAQISNTILWGNTASGSGDQMYNIDSGTTPSVSHSILEGGLDAISENDGSSTTDDGGNLDQAPQFADVGDPNGRDDTFATQDDGVVTAVASPAVDAGDNDALPAGVTEDITGADRTQDQDGDGTDTVNMGAYEVTTSGPPVVSTGSVSNITGTTADLSGTVHPNDAETTVQAQFYPTADPSDVTTSTASANPFTGGTEQSVTVSLRGLAPNTEYEARVIASNVEGGGRGSYTVFTTTDDGYARRIKGTDGTGNDAGWRILALPAAGKARSGLEDDLTFATNSGSILYRWTSGSWTAQTSSGDNLPRGRGFMLYFFDDVIDPVESEGLPLAVSTGSEDQSQDKQVTGLPTGETFHLLGNPFDVAFDLSALNLSAQGFQQTVQIWDPAAGSYTQVTQVGDDSDVIGAWQGLFVERTTEGEGETTLTFGAAGKKSGEGDLIGSQSTSAVLAGTKSRAEKRLRLDLHLTVTDSASVGGAEPPSPQAAATSAAPTREIPDSISAVAKNARSEAGVEPDTIATGQVGLLLSEDATGGWDAFEASQLGPPAGGEAAVVLSSPLTRGEASVLIRRAMASEPYPGESFAASVPISVQAHHAAGRATIRVPEAQRERLPAGWALRLTDAETGEQVDLGAGSYSFTLKEGDGTDLQSPAESRFRLAVGPEEALPVATEGLTLTAPYPNPAVRRATVEYAVPQGKAEGARLQLYDVLGRRVRTVPVEPGPRTRRLDVSGLASGVYVLRLTAGGAQQTRKLTVVR